MTLRVRATMALTAACLAVVFSGGTLGPARADTLQRPHASARAHLNLVHSGYLTVGSDTTYPPMESADVKHPGTYVGADVDLANALAHAMGLKGARIVATNFNSIIPALQRRNFDVIMSSMNDTPARRQQIAFIDYMKLNAAEAIIVPGGSSIHANGYAGICGHSIAVEAGTVEAGDVASANKHCKKKIDVKQYTHDTDAFQALASGHADSYTTDLPVALFYVKAHAGALRMAGKAFGSGGFYGIGLAQGNKVLRAALTRAFAKIHTNGQYVKILKKWGLQSTKI